MNDHILFCYHKQQDFYFLPGGSLEEGENSIHCLQREFKEETSLTITMGPFLGCLECHWQEDNQRYQEFDLIFEVNTEPPPSRIQSLESHISFYWLPLPSIIQGAYKILPAGVVKYLSGQPHSPSYLFEDQILLHHK
jgi:8-oxo-dGTP pyrophosphatase MutT (NUDIX family)